MPALAQVDRLEAWLAEAPQLAARARKLIRYAARLSETKLCNGRKKREAVEAPWRAMQASDDARAAITAGKPVDGVLTLRRIGDARGAVGGEGGPVRARRASSA